MVKRTDKLYREKYESKVLHLTIQKNIKAKDEVIIQEQERGQGIRLERTEFGKLRFM